jgi:transposase-like protein
MASDIYCTRCCVPCQRFGKHGKTKGYQRWKCPGCGITFSDKYARGTIGRLRTDRRLIARELCREDGLSAKQKCGSTF